MLRKFTPYLLFLALGALMLAGAAYAPGLIAKVYSAVPTDGLAATGAENAAGQQASGWVPSATVASKFIVFAGMYLLLVLLPWLVQHLTHPQVTRWAKRDYSKSFLRLTLQEQFAVNGRLQLVNAVKAVGAAVFAALVLSLLLILAPLQAAAQPTPCPLTWLAQHAAARETAGTNRGPEVDKIIVAGGGNPYQKKSPEYCGFTQAAANKSCRQPIPRNGMQGAAAAWFPLKGADARRTLFDRKTGRGSLDSIRVGLKAGYDYGAGIHHINCVAALGRPVRAGRAPRSYWAWGGNEGTGREAGVHYNVWAIGACDALSDWSQ